MAATNSGISYTDGWRRPGSKTVELTREGTPVSFSSIGSAIDLSGVVAVGPPSKPSEFLYIWGFVATTDSSTNWTGSLYSTSVSGVRADNPSLSFAPDDLALIGCNQTNPQQTWFDVPLRLDMGAGVVINQNTGAGNRFMTIYYTTQDINGGD